MPLGEEEMFQQVASLAQTIEPILPPAGKIGIVLFLSRIRKMLTLIKFSSEKSKFKKLIKTLNKETIDKLGSIGAGWLVHVDKGNYKITPRKLFIIWKTTIKGCLRMSSRNIIISCSMASISLILSFLPFYDKKNQFIILTQLFIKFAYTSISEFEEAMKIIDDSINLADIIAE